MGSIAYWWFRSTHPWSPTMLIQPKTHRFIKIDALLNGHFQAYSLQIQAIQPCMDANS